MPANTLYISYDGLTDALGRSQVLPYVTGLRRRGHRFTILSCEKPDRFASEGAKVRAICEAEGIAWRPLPYHQRPPVLSGVYDRIMLSREAARLHRETLFDIVHCRSYIPAAAGMALKRRFGVRFLFDMRGLWPEEKVEAGSWPQSKPLFRAIYNYFKRLEAKLFASSDHVVTLTRASLPNLQARPTLRDGGAGLSVIPCCADFEHFPLPTAAIRAEARRTLGIHAEAKVLAFLGSPGPWYLLDEMLDFFAVYQAKVPEALMLFVSHHPRELVVQAAARRGIPADRIVVRGATREEVPQFMSAADAGLFFIPPVPSKVATSPTKMAEMMALGLPVVANARIGDVEEILRDTGCGVTVRSFDQSGYEAAVEELGRISRSPAEVREAAIALFDLAEGVDRYDGIYRRLLGEAPAAGAGAKREAG
jgi:glycosyltransferase involved in cell wall biosynthesis